jgi:hypothetical protein
MSKTILGFSLVLAALACACGGSAEEQCHDLIESVCHRVNTCTEEISDTKLPTSFEGECEDAVEAAAGSCDKAVDVTSSYDKCMDDIKALPCEDFLMIDDPANPSVAIPSTCRGVIKVER